MAVDGIGAAAAASAVVAKGAGGAAIGGAVGSGLALGTILVMLAKKPRTEREWAMALLSTAASSLGGGAAVMLRYGLYQSLRSGDDLEIFFALLQLGGVFLACGLPGWALVRWVFNWMIKREGKDLGEVIKDAKELMP